MHVVTCAGAIRPNPIHLIINPAPKEKHGTERWAGRWAGGRVQKPAVLVSHNTFSIDGLVHFTVKQVQLVGLMLKGMMETTWAPSDLW